MVAIITGSHVVSEGSAILKNMLEFANKHITLVTIFRTCLLINFACHVAIAI